MRIHKSTLSQAYLNRGLVEQMKGNEAEAAKDFERCRALNEKLAASIDDRVTNLRSVLASGGSN
jgi:hypothetical protein